MGNWISSVIERSGVVGSVTYLSTAQDLVAKIAAAERERRVWEAGRKAFRSEGSAARNPYSTRSSNHALWADGAAAGCEAKSFPAWCEDA